MYPASPPLSVGTARVPQFHVRKFRLEVQEAESWQVPDRLALAARLRKRALVYVSSLLSLGGLLCWAGWELLHP